MKHFITPGQAKKLTKNFRQKRENMVRDEYRGPKTMPLCETFERAAFDALLAQPGCTSIRVYLGMDEGHEVKLIAVGVNEKGDDILPDANKLSDFAVETGLIVEEGSRCPEYCPSSSYMNTDETTAP
jgi:hypothetical protein